MSDGGRRARWLPEAMILSCTLMTAVVYATSRLYWFDASWKLAAYLAVAAPIVVVQLVHASSRTRRFRSRYGPLTLAAQALLAYVPYLFFGDMWIGLLAFLAASVPTVLRGPVAWPLFAAVTGSAGLFGGGYGGDAWGVGQAVLSTAFVGLGLHGLAQLGELVTRVHTTRDRLAHVAVVTERLRAARDLDQLLGAGLAAIARQSAAAATQTPATAAAAIAEVVGLARRTLNDARTVAGAYRNAGRAAEDLDGAGSRVDLRVVLGFHACFIPSTLFQLAAPRHPLEWAAIVGALLVFTLLQLHHTVHWTRAPHGPGRRWSLAAQALLAGALLPVFGSGWLVTFPALAVATWSVLTGRARWLPSALILSSVPPICVAFSLSASAVVWATVSQMAMALTFFGLARLLALAHELRAARAELTRMAVLAERLRVAGDVHDLLGYGLSAITLKSELAQRLLTDDPGRARAELTEVASLAHRTLNELRGVTGPAEDISFASEVASARSVLSTLGIEVDVAVAQAPLRWDTDRVLATVLREAVTNILRHSTASHVTVESDVAAGTDFPAIRLRVTNDGVHMRHRERPTGTGVLSLTGRVEALGGWLTTSVDAGGRFRLTATIPLGDRRDTHVAAGDGSLTRAE